MLIVVRHGQTAVNAAGRLLGRADPPLDDVGREQVATLRSAVGDAVAVVSSPLRRARETADALTPAGVAVTVDDRWIELDYGDYEGAALTELPADVWDKWRADVTFTPPGGESLLTLAARVRDACESLCEQASVADVVVVSHVSPIKAAVAWALGVGIEVSWRAFVAPASITRIACRADGTPSLQSFNERPWRSLK
jgi:broad specificity phosphatase PhoE